MTPAAERRTQSARESTISTCLGLVVGCPDFLHFTFLLQSSSHTDVGKCSPICFAHLCSLSLILEHALRGRHSTAKLVVSTAWARAEGQVPASRASVFEQSRLATWKQNATVVEQPALERCSKKLCSVEITCLHLYTSSTFQGLAAPSLKSYHDHEVPAPVSSRCVFAKNRIESCAVGRILLDLGFGFDAVQMVPTSRGR